MDLQFLISQALINGLIVGLLYLLMAVGFTVVFGVMGVVNFAHGECYMLGSFGAYVCVRQLDLPFAPAVLATFAAALVFGWLIEVIVLKPFRGDEINGMIVTLGLAMILQTLALMYFGPDPLSMPRVMEGSISVGAAAVPLARLYVAAFSVAVLIALYVFLKYTRSGRALRATTQDIEIASAQGISVHFMYPLGFGLGVGLAAIAGALMAPIFSVSPFIGNSPMIKAFIVVVLGGLGSIPGAVLASFILGIAESIGNTFLSTSMSDILIFLMMIVVLAFKPTGLMGIRDR